jgi:hypothetical protein
VLVEDVQCYFCPIRSYDLHMTPMQSQAVATVIGDLVSSRDALDRARLHTALAAAVSRANAELAPLTPLRITVGDEYQGVFATVGEALAAAQWLRLELAEHVDVRHGVGWGAVEVLDEEPRVEDGPGWWAARAAIEEAERTAGRPGLRGTRVRYRRADGTPGPDPIAVNAALTCRDALVAAGDARTLRLLRGLSRGRTQTDLAEEEGISPSAVSQRARNDGLLAVLAAEALLTEVA